MKPDLTKVTFLRDMTKSYSTKYRVSDGRGIEWVVKIGREAQSETAASRLVWAAGYFTDITYLVPRRDREHRYIFRLHALDADLAVKPGASKEELLTAMRNHVLAETQLLGKYKR